MTREDVVNKYATAWIWDNIFKQHFSRTYIRFIEIVLIEEIIPYTYYIGFLRVSYKKEGFIQATVRFNSKGKPSIEISPNILESLQYERIDGRILLDKINTPN
jgi:hypothetical protein